MSSPSCDVIERRACETFKNYRSTLDDVTDDALLRNVGGLLGDVSWQPFQFLESHGVGQFFLGESQSRIYPNMWPNLVAVRRSC